MDDQEQGPPAGSFSPERVYCKLSRYDMIDKQELPECINNETRQQDSKY